MGKKSNPTKNDNAKKRKKKNKSGPKAIDMKLKAPAPNPFEAIWSRRKFDILGKKRKGEERRIGLARSLAIEKRKKTLLKEYEQSAKSSVFVDKRIGEQNEELGEFDKAILRSQRERRLKLKKKSKYNLSDGEEEELDVGFSGGRDDFEDEVPFDEDEDDGLNDGDKRSAILEQLDSHGSQVMQHGLVEGQEDRQKSKKEVMEEIILKSKFFKAQKAKDKEENEQFVEQLDKDFTSMVHSKALVSLTQPDKISALKALVNKGIPNDNEKKSKAAESQRKDSLQKETPDSYDKLLSEMALDVRARASELAKTPEEIAQEEKERLERLEEERKKRMIAADDSSDEDDNNAYDDNDASAKKPISGDDLGDSFNDEKPRPKLGWIDEILRRENEDNSENEDESSDNDSESDEDDPEEEGSDEDDEHKKSQTVKDWEQSDDENVGTNLEDSEDDFGEGVIKESKVEKKSNLIEAERKEKDKIDTEKSQSPLKQHSAQRVELPYTIEAPKSFEEFTTLLEKCSDEQVIEAISRIRAFNAIKVAAENRKKMQVFYGILLQYFAVLANKVPLNLKFLNSLVRPLMEMSAEIPYFAAICARQRLHRTRVLLCEDLKNEGKNCWPSMKTLFLLRLWSLIFPCSDFRHAVITPAILLMSEYLTRCPITCGRDVAVGSFLCSMMLSVVKHSLKYCPEAIIFIQTLLLAALDKKQVHSNTSQLNSLLEIKGVRPLLHIQSRHTETKALNFVMLMELPADSPYFSSDEFRASILVAIMETIQGFVNIYEGLNSFPEIFMPIAKLLNELAAQNHMPDILQEKIKSVIQLIENKVEENHRLRQPLRMRKQKPVPIKMVNPKFEENFVKGRDYDPDRERAEMRKLKKRIKQEAKGAAREIRKDNHFLFGVKEKEKAALAEERSEKYGKALAFLQEQEHAFKSGQLGGNRKRRR
nr:nucleolar protein 14 isoform X1 [Ipomoea batatas]